MKILLLVLGAMAVLFFAVGGISGAGENNNEGNDKNAAEGESSDSLLLGEWYDINSDTVLAIDRNRIEIRYGNNWKQEYPYTVKKDSGYVFLVFNGDFFSRIEVAGPDRLIAYEEILDGHSRKFDFARKENMAARLAIKDNSKNMPKEIVSDEIEEFSFNFHNGRGRDYGLAKEWPQGSYSISVEHADNGEYQFDFYVQGDSYVVARITSAVTPEFMKGLDKVIKSGGIPGHNGYNRKNDADRDGYGLSVSYKSEEKISIFAYGNAADTSVFDFSSILEYFRNSPELKAEFDRHLLKHH